MLDSVYRLLFGIFILIKANMFMKREKKNQMEVHFKWEFKQLYLLCPLRTNKSFIGSNKIYGQKISHIVSTHNQYWLYLIFFPPDFLFFQILDWRMIQKSDFDLNHFKEILRVIFVKCISFWFSWVQNFKWYLICCERSNHLLCL